jgi:uncharacterized protein
VIRAIGSKKELTDLVYFSHVSDIVESDEIEQLKEITHHISTTRFQHCVNVSYYSYIVCRRFNLDAHAAARAGLMHDLFYYDRRAYNTTRSKGQISHSMLHALMAAENASRLVEISDMERDMIEKHMWPATHKFPKYKESYVVCLVDKYCAVLEYLSPKLKKCAFFMGK